MAKRKAQSAGVAGFLFGSGLRTVLSALAAVAVAGGLGLAAWSIYDYGGLKKAQSGLATQQQQARDHLRALGIEQRQAERDHDQLKRAGEAVDATTDVSAAGRRWLTVWLNCVHPDRNVQSCAGVPDPGRAAGPADSRRADDRGAGSGAEQDRERPPESTAVPGDHRRAAASLPGVTE